MVAEALLSCDVDIVQKLLELGLRRRLPPSPPSYQPPPTKRHYWWSSVLHRTFYSSSPPRCIAFSPDGSLLAVAGGGNTTARLFNTHSWTVDALLELGTTGGETNVLAFSLDSRYLCTGHSSDGYFQLWDVGTGNLLRSLHPPKTLLTSGSGKAASFLSDAVLFTAKAGTPQLFAWRVPSGELAQSITFKSDICDLRCISSSLFISFREGGSWSVVEFTIENESGRFRKKATFDMEGGPRILATSDNLSFVGSLTLDAQRRIVKRLLGTSNVCAYPSGSQTYDFVMCEGNRQVSDAWSIGKFRVSNLSSGGVANDRARGELSAPTVSPDGTLLCFINSRRGVEVWGIPERKPEAVFDAEDPSAAWEEVLAGVDEEFFYSPAYTALTIREDGVDCYGNNVLMRVSFPLSVTPEVLLSNIDGWCLRKGADALRAANHAGQTILHMVCYRGVQCTSHETLRQTVEKLIARGCDPNARDVYGNTPLHYAAYLPENPTQRMDGKEDSCTPKSSYEFVKRQLVECGADESIENNFGQTAETILRSRSVSAPCPRSRPFYPASAMCPKCENEDDFEVLTAADGDPSARRSLNRNAIIYEPYVVSEDTALVCSLCGKKPLGVVVMKCSECDDCYCLPCDALRRGLAVKQTCFRGHLLKRKRFPDSLIGAEPSTVYNCDRIGCRNAINKLPFSSCVKCGEESSDLSKLYEWGSCGHVVCAGCRGKKSDDKCPECDRSWDARSKPIVRFSWRCSHTDCGFDLCDSCYFSGKPQNPWLVELTLAVLTEKAPIDGIKIFQILREKLQSSRSAGTELAVLHQYLPSTIWDSVEATGDLHESTERVLDRVVGRRSSPIHLIDLGVAFNSLGVVQVLLAANVSLRFFGTHALQIAAEMNNFAMCNLLLQGGAKSTQQTLCAAAKCGSPRTFSFLLELLEDDDVSAILMALAELLSDSSIAALADRYQIEWMAADRWPLVRGVDDREGDDHSVVSEEKVPSETEEHEEEESGEEEEEEDANEEVEEEGCSTGDPMEDGFEAIVPRTGQRSQGTTQPPLAFIWKRRQVPRRAEFPYNSHPRMRLYEDNPDSSICPRCSQELQWATYQDTCECNRDFCPRSQVCNCGYVRCFSTYLTSCFARMVRMIADYQVSRSAFEQCFNAAIHSKSLLAMRALQQSFPSFDLTCLQLLSLPWDEPSLKFFLDHNCDIDQIRDTKGNTIAHLTCDLRLLQMLQEAGTFDFSSKNSAGQTPLDSQVISAADTPTDNEDFRQQLAAIRTLCSFGSKLSPKALGYLLSPGRGWWSTVRVNLKIAVLECLVQYYATIADMLPSVSVPNIARVKEIVAAAVSGTE